MNRKHTNLIRIALVLLAAFNLSGAIQAIPQAVPELYVFPAEGAPGTMLYLSAYNIPPGTYEVQIWDGVSPTKTSLCNLAIVGRSGSLLQCTASLPELSAGPYTILINSPDYGASTPFTVLPALTLSLNPTSGAPGTVVDFSVTNLPAGSLRIDYAGTPIFGPVAVGAGSYQGNFTAPSNRPAHLGDPVQVQAKAIVANRAAGNATATFTSQPIPTPTVYHFSAINLPPGPILPGQPFQINGEITPPLTGPLTQFDLKVLWKTGGGQIFPITNGLPTIQQNGAFSVSAILPSLLNGAPQPAEEGGQVGLVFFSNGKDLNKISSYTPFGGFPAPPPFRIKVQDLNGNPIPNAIVDLRGALANQASYISGSKSDGSKFSMNVGDLASQPNQLLVYGNGTIFPTEKDPFNCAAGAIYGRTDSNGIFQPKLALDDWLALAGKKVAIGAGYPGVYIVNPTEITFSVYVTAQYQGFGQVTNQVPVPWTMDIRYKAAAGAFYEDTSGPQVPLNTNPLNVFLPPLPPGTHLEQPIELQLAGATPLKKFTDFLGTGIPLSAFGNFTSFSNSAIYPDSIFVHPNDSLEISFAHDATLYGSLDQSNITLKMLDTNQVYPFQPYTTAQCGNITYTAKIPQYYRLAPGGHIGLVQVQDMANPPNITKRYIQFAMIAPPTWFGNTLLVNRSIDSSFHYFGKYMVKIKADLLAPGDPANTSTLDANLNKVGPVANNAGASGTYLQDITTSGAGTRKFQGKLGYEAVNSPGSQDISQDATTNTPITFKNGPITILDSGKFPLFRDTWGIEPIAGATLGADMWFKATLTYDGSIQISGPGGSASYNITVNPEAKVGVDVWLDASALLGLVEAEAHAIPNISMGLPVSFVNGVKTDTTKCFKYKLDVSWSASVGYCPLCLSDGGTENIFQGHTPNPSSYCSDPAIVQQLAINTPAMPASSPSLAADGVGGVLEVWRADDGTIQASQYNGLQWLPAVQISSNQSSGAARVAFFAPGKALAVWTQSGLTPAESQNANLATRVLNQHLVYATWNGASWSAPQDLTLPTSGDGAITLAGCPSSNPSCPAGGEVTAAWVHDAAGDLSQHQTRVYFAKYQSGAWSAVQAVELDQHSHGQRT